jgi:hypothetical protein
MRRRAVVVLLGTCAAGVVALALTASADERRLAFNLNVQPERPVAVLPAGGSACQRLIATPARFDVVEVLLGTYARPGPPLTIVVRDHAARRILASGALAPGAADNKPALVPMGPAVAKGRLIDVCVENRGVRRVALYGGPRTDSTSEAFQDGRPLPDDIRILFHRSEPRSALSLVPEMFRRANLLRPDPIGVWTFWALLAAVGIGVPLLLAAGLRRALADPPASPEWG